MMMDKERGWVQAEDPAPSLLFFITAVPRLPLPLTSAYYMPLVFTSTKRTVTEPSGDPPIA